VTLEQAKKSGINCWLLAATESNASFFIRVNDWHRSIGGLFISNNGSHRYPIIDVWVRGYHGEDRGVPYRWSSSLYRFECGRGVVRFARDQFLTYDAIENLIEKRINQNSMEVAIPGSKEEQLGSIAC